MREIVEFIQNLEQLAVSVYKQLSDMFSYDEKISNFLSKMAEDESYHFKAMNRASQYVEEHNIVDKNIIIDEKTRNSIELPLRELQDLTSPGPENEDKLFELLIRAEFSEWNDFFLYIIKSLAKESQDFQKMSSIIQSHEQRIESFFKLLDKGTSYLAKIGGLPRLWNTAILIVEDNDPYRELLLDILSDDYKVAGVVNGSYALKELKNHFYDIIISDVDMPEINGIELFNKLSSDDPDIRDKFLFMTGDPGHEEDFKELNVRYLFKPFPLEDLYEVIGNIISIKASQ